MIRFFLAVLFSIALSNCSLLSPVKTEPQTTYVLNTAPIPATKKPNRSITLLVSQPEVSLLYNTTQMAYTTMPYQIAYFAKNRWAETPARMLQPLIAQTLQRTHYFHAVMTTALTGGSDFLLNTQLLEIQQDFTVNPSQLHFVLRAQLIDLKNNRIIASKLFSVKETVPQNTPYGGVIAANHAASKILLHLSTFCLQELS